MGPRGGTWLDLLQRAHAFHSNLPPVRSPVTFILPHPTDPSLFIFLDSLLLLTLDNFLLFAPLTSLGFFHSTNKSLRNYFLSTNMFQTLGWIVIPCPLFVGSLKTSVREEGKKYKQMSGADKCYTKIHSEEG